MFEAYVVISRSVRNGMSRAGPPYAPASRSTSSTGSLTTTVVTVSRKATDSSWANPTSGLPPMNTRRRSRIRLAGWPLDRWPWVTTCTRVSRPKSMSCW